MAVSKNEKRTRKWLEEVKELIEFGNIDTKIDIPSDLGSGYVECIRMLSGFYLIQVNAEIPNGERFKITPAHIMSEEYIHTYIFDNSDRSTVLYGNNRFEPNPEISNGIYMISPSCINELSFELSDRVAMIVLAFSRNSISKLLAFNNNRFFNRIFDSKSSYFFQHPLAPKLNKIVDSIIKPEVVSTLSVIYKHSKAVELLANFWQEIINKYDDEPFVNVKPSDISNVLMVRNIVLSDLNAQPGVTRLANVAAMSQSKLHKVFKQVFGQSVYQYRLDARMDEARKMLDTRKYSVRDIGHSLGYANISQFIKAFRKIYGTTPKGYTK